MNIKRKDDMKKKLIDFISHLIYQLSHPHIPNTHIYPIWNRVGEREGLGGDWGCGVGGGLGEG
jgi:hypothetical protein